MRNLLHILWFASCTSGNAITDQRVLELEHTNAALSAKLDDLTGQQVDVMKAFIRLTDELAAQSRNWWCNSLWCSRTQDGCRTLFGQPAQPEIAVQCREQRLVWCYVFTEKTGQAVTTCDRTLADCTKQNGGSSASCMGVE